MSSKIIFTLYLALVLTSCDTTSTDSFPESLPSGVWGSDEAVLRIENDSATITWACAEGIIEDGIFVDHRGDFESTGTLTSGPVAKPSRPVRYRGTVLNNEMELTVDFTDSSATMGTYLLDKGRDSNVEYICRC